MQKAEMLKMLKCYAPCWLWTNASLVSAPGDGDNLRYRFKCSHSLSLPISLSLSLSLHDSLNTNSIKGTHLAVVKQSASINTLAFDMFRYRGYQLQQLAGLSGCTHKVATGHATYIPHTLSWHATWCSSYTSMCIHQLVLASAVFAVKFCLNEIT